MYSATALHHEKHRKSAKPHYFGHGTRGHRGWSTISQPSVTLVNLSNCLNFATGKLTGKQQKEFLRLYVHLKSYYSTVTVASIVLILEAPQSRLFGVQRSAHVLPKIYITLYVSQSKFVWPMHIFAPFIYQLLGVP